MSIEVVDGSCGLDIPNEYNIKLSFGRTKPFPSIFHFKLLNFNTLLFKVREVVKMCSFDRVYADCTLTTSLPRILSLK